ncbi:helix-turn-helix transcriptional regulator [Peristeroidobacter soli]|uniref:helix-turn-helix transcriptional regulator n=1 Tax=Peristeroidobacter soli TaxID=2497877 RepID=UPI00101B9C78|nr:helix-turn-helix transcriptional regulator [Peristeroidobacter soli]
MMMTETRAAASRGSMVDALGSLHRAVDIEGLWESSVRLMQSSLHHHSCSLMLGIDDYRPVTARHHVQEPLQPGYVPATSLTVSQPFLATHPKVQLYTFSQIADEDPRAHERRIAQEAGSDEWCEFVHLAFWNETAPQAVFSIRRSARQSRFSSDELALLQQIYPAIDAGLHRLRTLERERFKSFALEQALSRSTAAVILTDRRGRVLFATPEGRRLCSRWAQASSGRPGTEQPADELPADLVQSIDSRRSAGVDDTQSLRHAVDTDLTVTVDDAESDAMMRTEPAYVLHFSATNERLPQRERASEILGRLSPSERKVALLVAEGLRNEQIAQRLSRSRRTVESQLNAVFGKLGLVCRAQLVKVLS